MTAGALVCHMANVCSLDLVFNALADPTRRAIIGRLTNGPASVSELAEPFEIGLPTFLKHIRVLEEGGLVSTMKAGRVRTCNLTPGALRSADAWLQLHIATWEDRLDQLEAHLAHLSEKDRDND